MQTKRLWRACGAHRRVGDRSCAGWHLPLLVVVPALVAINLLAPVAQAAPTRTHQTGGRIAFTFTVDFGDWDVYVVNGDGTGLTDLTPGTPGSRDDLPAWSPDATRIAFSSDRTGTFNLYVMGSDGTDPTLIPGTEGARQSAWSPDGEQIAFQAETAGISQIYVLDADGGGAPTQVTHNTRPLPEDCCGFSWSTDGRRIIFTGNTGDVACNGSECLAIYSIATDGHGQRQLTRDTLDSVNPQASPSGNEIIFNIGFNENSDIARMHADGSHFHQLTNTPETDDFLPAWSPNRMRVVYVSTPHFVTPTELFTMRANGTDNEQLIALDGWAFSPAWASPS
jgi:Tol biopolymer transport system component